LTGLDLTCTSLKTMRSSLSSVYMKHNFSAFVR